MDTNPSRKTIKPEIPTGKTGRKFTKLHMENIKRLTLEMPNYDIKEVTFAGVSGPRGEEL